MSLINAQDWSHDQVADWIQGLEASLSIYGQHFVSKHVNGAKLLSFMAGDLEFFGVHRVGDQLLLYDAILSLRSELEADRITMQTLASRLGVRCKTYRSELSNLPRKNRIPNESLASAAYLLDSAKSLLRWMTRFPFLGKLDYDKISRNLTKHSFELALLSQRDSFADNAIEDVQYLCTKLIEICDYIILECKDSLILQPAAVDVITIRKRQEQELGLQFESNYSGVHLVSGVALNSPAQQSGHLERGDEVLQINYQTVVAWNQHSLISLLEENPCEVILTVKRRPRHACNMLGHMYLRPNRVPTRKVASPVLEEEYIKQISEEEIAEANDDYQETESVTCNAETRFWKLYPRPKNLIKRRATVSGASPTSSRPPVTFVKDNTSVVSHRRHPLDKSKSESHKMDLDDHILKLFIGKCNTQGSRITLPLMENLVREGSDLMSNRTEQVAENQILGESSEVSQIISDKTLEALPHPDKYPIPVPSSSSDLGVCANASNSNSCVITGDPIYSGYLHKRGQWKLGPRWTRFKAALYPKLLKVGTCVYKLGPGDYVIGLASEVHSRPFAFKLEELKTADKSTIYVAAESQLDMQIWIKALSVETELLSTTDSNKDTFQVSSSSKLFRRSTSLQSGLPPFHPEKPQRRISLPPLNKSPRSKVPSRTAFQMKSNSTSRLDERRCLTSTATPPPYTKSNISSITITSLKRYEGNISDCRPKLRTLKHEVQHNPGHVTNHDSSCKPSRSSTAIDEIYINSRPNSQILEKDSGKLRMGVGMLNWKDTNHNASFTHCRACGSKLNVHKTDTSTQTNDNIFILIKGERQSAL